MKQKFSYQFQKNTLKNIGVRYVFLFLIAFFSFYNFSIITQFSDYFSNSQTSFFISNPSDFNDVLLPDDGINNPIDYPAEAPENKEESKNEKESKDEAKNEMVFIQNTIHSFLSNSIENKSDHYLSLNILKAEKNPLYLLYHSFKIFYSPQA